MKWRYPIPPPMGTENLSDMYLIIAIVYVLYWYNDYSALTITEINNEFKKHKHLRKLSVHRRIRRKIANGDFKRLLKITPALESYSLINPAINPMNDPAVNPTIRLAPGFDFQVFKKELPSYNTALWRYYKNRITQWWHNLKHYIVTPAGIITFATLVVSLVSLILTFFR